MLGFGATAAVSLIMPRTANSRGMPVVVELFTSQGCSSCPPADAFLGELVGRENVIGLSLNIDYWDYIGWRDTLASPANTKRQRDYARKRGDNRIYTPQMVINGNAHAVGSDRATVLRIIDEESARTERSIIPISIRDRGTELDIFVGAASNDIIRKESTILLFTLLPVVTVEIEKGENAGKQVSYYNVVRKMMPVGMWQGDPAYVKLPKEAIFSDPRECCVCILQISSSGYIVGAAPWGFKSRQSRNNQRELPARA
ncbi:MAG TPA: DUF1223 domain-containing protein [Aestuariivirgaceae bacterium]|jgi:hypothetical protein